MNLTLFPWLWHKTSAGWGRGSGLWELQPLHTSPVCQPLPPWSGFSSESAFPDTGEGFQRAYGSSPSRKPHGHSLQGAPLGFRSLLGAECADWGGRWGHSPFAGRQSALAWTPRRSSELNGAGFPHRTRCRPSLGLGTQGGTGGAARKSCFQ